MQEQWQLDNGLRVVAERIPHFRSIAIGVWIKAGSQDEGAGENGVSHFIEHMLFKGTQTRDAKRIAQEIDAIGGQINAFTSKECTCYYVKVMDEHLAKATDVLADLVLHPALDAAELEKERGVILEEISMTEDTPEDLVHELLAAAHWRDDPLGRTILGPAQGIRAMKREHLIDYRARKYHPANAVVSVAGNYDPAQLRECMEACFAAWPSGTAETNTLGAPELTRDIRLQPKDAEQMHLTFGFEGYKQGHEDAYALAVLNNILGGGMSARLFQSIREERGLAYSIYSYPTTYARAGAVSVYAGINPANARVVTSLIGREFRRAMREVPAQDEFDQGREQLKGAYILGQESTSSRMTSIGRQLLLRGEIIDEEETLRRIARVTREDMLRVACHCLSGAFSASAVGKLPKNIDLRAWYEEENA